MKKISTVMLATITILTVLFSFLPMSTVQAKKDDQEVTLKVRNRTGGKVLLTLIDKNGNRQYFEFAPGQTNTSLFEGEFSYYAGTPCGNQSGEFNLNVTKELYLSCGEGVEVNLTVPTKQYCYSVWDYPSDDFEDNWMDFGPHCQDTPAQVGDEHENEYLPGSWATTIYVNTGSDLSECVPDFGAGYYYPYDECCDS